MNWSETLWRFSVVARFGWWEFRVENPPVIVLTALLPRAVLQCLFFTVLGRVIGLADPAFAFIGSLAVILTLSGAVAVMDVPMLDKWSGTFYRIRGGRLPAFPVFLVRSLPYTGLGLLYCVVAMVVVAPLTGLTGTLPALLPWLPVYLLMAWTTSAAGLAGAALAVGRRADGLAGNLLAYLVLLASGVLLPPGRLPWVDALGTVLPVRNGLLAVRSGMAGEPWAGHLLAEAAVGAAWLLLAWLVVAWQVRRARAGGGDDFA
ncbi:ABC transporter permease [Streptomyces sp. F63]|uniref:ABC transporter permease n=1 Tax=Streptomyces sp. F63 TaxID=2824887 RepID=UPI001B37B8F0|nr:ABC transporter permease [Streptomyces sp. F63]MBQ0983203.1 ABC transporter permease [Streptomyces sp. F63]